MLIVRVGHRSVPTPEIASHGDTHLPALPLGERHFIFKLNKQDTRSSYINLGAAAENNKRGNIKLNLPRSNQNDGDSLGRSRGAFMTICVQSGMHGNGRARAKACFKDLMQELQRRIGRAQVLYCLGARLYFLSRVA